MVERDKLGRRTSAEALVDMTMAQRGPLPDGGRGPGRRWNGVVEETDCLWVNWCSAAARAAGVPMEDFHIAWYGIDLRHSEVNHGIGPRFYWLCPICARRCE